MLFSSRNKTRNGASPIRLHYESYDLPSDRRSPYCGFNRNTLGTVRSPLSPFDINNATSSYERRRLLQGLFVILIHNNTHPEVPKTQDITATHFLESFFQNVSFIFARSLVLLWSNELLFQCLLVMYYY